MRFFFRLILISFLSAVAFILLTQYVDGIEVARDTQAITAAPLKHSNGGLYIGTSKTLKVGSFFSGLIDDVRIYNVALSAEKISALTQ